MIVQRLPQFHTAILYNYPDDDSPQRQPVFQQHPNIVARSKSGSIPKICWDAVNILDNLADGNDPDQNFAEPKQGSKVPLSARNKNNPDGSQGYICNPGSKDDQR